MKERELRKNNLIMKGLHMENATQEELVRGMEEFLRKEVEVRAKVENVTRIGNKMYLLKVARFDRKIAILKSIHRLLKKGISVKIYADLTDTEKGIQNAIKYRAELERDKGKHVKVGYQRLFINHQPWMWNEKNGRLEILNKWEMNSELGRKVELLERQKKMKNVVINGLHTISQNDEDLKRELESFFAENLNVFTKVVNVTRPRKSLCIAKLEKVQDKLRLLKNRRLLRHRGINVFIDSDLTFLEKEIQNKIERRAEKERLKGHFVKVGHGKIYINGTTFVWNEQQNKLVEVMTTNQSD